MTGTTHEGCRCRFGGWLDEVHLFPCPDGRPVYWTVSDD